MMAPSKNAVKSDEVYEEFYEKLGRYYPETRLVHADRGQKSRFQAVLEELRPFALEKARLLDVGCNNGVYTIPYVRMGGRALGIDISGTLVNQAWDFARKLLPSSESISFGMMDIQEDLEYSSLFDVVLMSEVLEHLNHPEKAILNIYKLLKKGGQFLLTCPTPMFEITPKIGLRYLRNLYRGKLREENILSSDRNALSRYSLSGYAYRHDGYYPLGLMRFVEKFGFRCVRIYTIGFGRSRLMVPGTYHLEPYLRRLPTVNLLGITNFQVFRKR